MTTFEKWKNSSWKEQVDSGQPVVCLGCLKQMRYGSKIMCNDLGELLDGMRFEEKKVKCPSRVTH